MKRVRNLYIILSILLICVSVSGCKDSNFETIKNDNLKVPRPEVVKIGVFEPVTGAYSYAGNLELEGIKLANQLYPFVDDIKIELVVMDNQSDKLASARVVSDLIQNEGVSALIGSWSSTLSLSAGPIINDLKVPAVAPTSTNQDLTIGNDYYFRACFSDAYQGSTLAGYAYYDLGIRTIALVTERGNDYSNGLGRFFADRFVELNDSDHNVIIYRIEYDPNQILNEEEFDKIIISNPDAIFIPGGYSETAHWIKKAREYGYDGIFIGGDTWDNDVFVTYGGKSVEGAIFSSFYTSEIALTQESTVFLENYKNKYGKEPTAIAALGYDAYLMIKDAIQRSASSDPEELKNALKEISNLSGAAGLITMNELGEPERILIIKTVKDGAIRSITTIDN
ncbi:ABC transporter substrate-binding protein [Acidaminobacter hydrogenoformans]|uniref:Amino acid/amide ABC transporter substrate-binding protein, HAAT family n=1 Tax=Acidaminobacter hydrogenoformans DSM 2784 TaxID=1120920 RepID=A0A1G5RRN5_9FIRM|nr:ABC transporter substrate-binding protein [Acidaminobacter hydrogenoformans]SCZ76677.1 amino acid/amide ABC transporter substrate-binding protein, HAAT family [Acidaminobacter hydrogenoformans DSM 2784]